MSWLSFKKASGSSPEERPKTSILGLDATNSDPVRDNAPAEGSATPQIIAEMLMSAGPRKSQDIELGEDACGLIMRPRDCFFWIADGTSESAILEDEASRVSFSSRRLAHDLGAAFRTLALETPTLKDSAVQQSLTEKLLRGSLEAVMQQWVDNLKQLENDERQFLNEAFNDGSGDSKDFSSTFLCGLLSTNSSLQMAAYGDSPFVVKFNETIKVYRPKNYRFFMRLRREADSYAFSTSRDIRAESFCFENTRFVVAGSDGIGKLPEMIEALSGKFEFSDIRKHFALYRPRTHDDKSVCIVSLEGF